MSYNQGSLDGLSDHGTRVSGRGKKEICFVKSWRPEAMGCSG
jgi:hypothetical protein